MSQPKSPPTPNGGGKMTEGRCMKCKAQVTIKDEKQVTMANGMNAVQGVCPTCGTKVFRILGKAK
jgi:DNA-directed RNA polymerase subunit RPC12/RpoP